jgi:DNA-binding transcriptional regulator PaaX
LLRQFHRQSPIRGGSLLITIFGDSIAPRGGAISLGSLIDLAHPFGLAERLVRTSVARLAREGWLVGSRNGRRSEYRLAATGQQRFAEATRRIYGQTPSSWSGQWTLLVLPPASGSRRQKLREELRWLGFGQVSPGVFAHANWNMSEARAALDALEGAAEGVLFNSSSESLEADRRLVAAGWNLQDLARRYRKFVATFTPVADAAAARLENAAAAPSGASRATTWPADPSGSVAGRSGTLVGESGAVAGPSGSLAGGSGSVAEPSGSLAGGSGSTRQPSGSLPEPSDAHELPNAEAAFVIRTLLIHEYRKIHLQDPLLPPALLPAGWIGAAAYDLSKTLYSAVFEAAEAYLSARGRGMTEPLPPANAATYERFGGLSRATRATTS